MMKIRSVSSYVFVLLAVTFVLAGRADALVMAFWDFGTDTTYTEQVLIDRIAGTPTILIQGGDKDDNGKTGLAYVDADAGAHAPGRAAAWDNVNADSEIIITVETTGWVDMVLRWDYSSENTVGNLGPISFDMDYRVGPTGNWVELINNQPLTRDALWHTFSKNVVLLSQIENRPFVEFRINDLSAGDESGGAFRIDNVELTGAPIPSSILLLTPNGGENLMAGQFFDIRWQTGGTLTSVKLEYSLNSGAQWTTIATVPNTGLYVWQIPDANSLNCRVRASNAANTQVFDISNSNFRIFRCLLNFDLNGDCYIDLYDLALLASEWMQCGDVLDPRCL